MHDAVQDPDHGGEENDRLGRDRPEHPFEDFGLGSLGCCFNLRVPGNPQGFDVGLAGNAQSLDVGFGGNAQRFANTTYSGETQPLKTTRF